jgi:hypothetical protein
MSLNSSAYCTCRSFSFPAKNSVLRLNSFPANKAYQNFPAKQFDTSWIKFYRLSFEKQKVLYLFSVFFLPLLHRSGTFQMIVTENKLSIIY